jgi:hypothetical protein
MSPVTKARGLPSRSPGGGRRLRRRQIRRRASVGGVCRRGRARPPRARPLRHSSPICHRPKPTPSLACSNASKHPSAAHHPTQTTPPTTAPSARAQETQAPRPLATSRSLRRRRTRREQPSPPGKIRPRLNASLPRSKSGLHRDAASATRSASACSAGPKYWRRRTLPWRPFPGCVRPGCIGSAWFTASARP